MPTERLRRRADFLAAAAGSRARSEAFTVQALRREDEGPARIGFTVSRKVGNAVERNRAKRRLREVVRLAPAGALASGHDYVLVARRAAITTRFDQLGRDFEQALHRLSRQAQTDRAQTDNKVASPAIGANKSGK